MNYSSLTFWSIPLPNIDTPQVRKIFLNTNNYLESQELRKAIDNLCQMDLQVLVRPKRQGHRKLDKVPEVTQHK